MQWTGRLTLLTILLVVVCVLFFIFVQMGWIALGIGGYRAEIMGTVSYSPLPGIGWGVNAFLGEVSEDTILFSSVGFGITSKGVAIQVVGDGIDAWTDIGDMNLDLGDSKPYIVTLRHVPEGEHHLTIRVYEVERLLFFDLSRDFVKETTLTINIP